MGSSSRTSGIPWGTLEELLLVSAVKVHGTSSWDSVVMEVQSRSSAFSNVLLTPHDCLQKFDDLKRRSKNDNDESDDTNDWLAPMVDELRRLRVEELRRELRRRDVTIVALELKVKRLAEERERSLKAEVAAGTGKDLQRGEEDRPEKLAGKIDSDSGERENRSFNESNSTSQGGEAKENGVAAAKQAEVGPGTDLKEPDPIRVRIWSEPDRDCSNNNDGKAGGGRVVAGRVGESNELGESVCESKREGKRGRVVAWKQNGDVQSSASLSVKNRRRVRGGGDEGGGRSRSRSRSRRSSSGEEGEEGDEVSPATSEGVKQLKLIKHEPLIVKVLTIIRSHRLGSVFDRRLRSQESERYKSFIRQHMDLHEIESRLNKGVYAGCTHLFFRDILLLFTNAVVFFGKASPEHIAAQELRSIVLKEMNDHLLPKPQPVVHTVKYNVPLKIEPDTYAKRPYYTSSKQPRKASIIVCGLRSSSAYALSEGSTKRRKGVKKEREEVDLKANENMMDGDDFVKSEDKGVRKRRTGGGGRRGGRTSSSSSSRNEVKTEHEFGVNELSSHDGLEEMKMEKKENVRDKQGAAEFLKRMKQNSSSTEVNTGNSDESEDDSEDSMLDEDGKKNKRNKGKKKIDDKDRVTRSSARSGGRGRGRGRGRRGQESSGRGTKRIGRPPKRPESAGVGSGKRGRENGEADEVGSAGRPRKRTRR